MTRDATEKERDFIEAIRKPPRRGAVIFFCGLLIILILLITYGLGILPAGVVATALIIMSGPIIIKRNAADRRELEALHVNDRSGSIEKVIRQKGIVSAICIAGRQYVVLDAEPVSEGTKVKIAFLPQSRRIVSLVRIYEL